jgi:hypothetical protein
MFSTVWFPNVGATQGRNLVNWYQAKQGIKEGNFESESPLKTSDFVKQRKWNMLWNFWAPGIATGNQRIETAK